MAKRAKRAFVSVVIILLLLLFTLPHRYLDRVCREMSALTAQAEAACMAGGDAGPMLTRLQKSYEAHSGRLKLFLDHVSVDAVGAAIAACTPQSEPETLISELRTVSAALSHLRGIESFTAESLF